MHAFGRVGEEVDHEVAVHRLAHKGDEGGADLGEGDERMPEGDVSRLLVLTHLAAPIAFPAAAHIPVGKLVHELLNGARALGDHIFVQALVHIFDKRVQSREQPLVHAAQSAVLELILARIELVYLGIEHEKGISVPERAHELALGFGDVVRAETGGEPGGGRGIEIPSHRVRALLVQNAPRVDDVALMLAHLDPVLVVDVTQDHAVLEGRPVEKQGGDGEQGVKPTARLIHRLADEVGGELALEELLILERIMELRERHAARISPAVEDFGGAVHGLAADGALYRHRVDIGLVKFDVARQAA